MSLLNLDVFIIALLLFCVIVVVVGMPRRGPSFQSFFVRGFTSKNAETNEENQEQIKSVNWKKGLFRLTLVFSVLFGVFAAFANGETRNSYLGFLESFFIFFGLTWLIYFSVGFVIRGFESKK